MRGVNVSLDNFPPLLNLPDNGWLLPLGSALTALLFRLLVFLPYRNITLCLRSRHKFLDYFACCFAS